MMDQVILFLHIPKSAGSTFTSCLTEYYYNHNYDLPLTIHPVMNKFYEGDIFYYPIGFFKDPENWFPKYIIPFLKEPTVKVVTGHFSFGIHTYIDSESKYISILRDPVERVLSLYYHLISTQILNENVSLEQFLTEIPDTAFMVKLTRWHPLTDEVNEGKLRKCFQRMIDNDQTRRISGIEPPFGKCNSRMFKKACENIEKKFLMVGLTEKFNETLLLLGHLMNWNKELYYIPRLVNRAKPAKEKMPNYIISRIEQLNYWDLLLYEFARKCFNEKIEQLGADFKMKIEEFSSANKSFIEKSKDVNSWDIGK